MNFLEFIERLLAARGMTRQKIAPHVYDELVEDVKKRLEEAVNAEMVSALNPDDLARLEELMDAAETSQDQLETFFTDRVPDFSDRLSKVLLDFHGRFLAESMVS